MEKETKEKNKDLSWPKISIITPSYNQGQFIEDTIKSVLDQEGDFFIDYIIADGGSTDNSVEIIKKYDELLKNKKYPIRCKGIEYRWWSRKDNGQSNAINQGFKVAKGDILAWINSDDFYELGVLDFIIKKFKENPDTDLIYGDSYLIKENTKKKTLMKSRQVDFKTTLKRNFIYQPSTFFTKDIIKKIGFLDENLHHSLDYDFWLRILQQGKGLYFPKTLSSFRVWEGAKTSPQREKELFSRDKTLRKYSNGTGPSKYYSYDRKIKDFEYLFKKHKEWLEKYPSIYAVQLIRLGSMNLLAGETDKSKKNFLQSIKIKPGIINISTFFLSLLGRHFYWFTLRIKRKITYNFLRIR